MKKVNYLMTVLFAVALLSTSCCKEDVTPDINEGLITLDELNGSWNFVSYTYDGTDYDCSSNPLPEYMDYIFINATFTTNTFDVSINDACAMGDTPLSYSFIKEKNSINFMDGNDVRYIFTIINYDDTHLKLRVDQTPYIYNYLGGTLTLVK